MDRKLAQTAAPCVVRGGIRASDERGAVVAVVWEDGDANACRQAKRMFADAGGDCELFERVQRRSRWCFAIEPTRAFGDIDAECCAYFFLFLSSAVVEWSLA